MGCGKEGEYICKKCDIYVSENSFVCPVCFQTSLTGETHSWCSGRYELDGLVSIWQYDGIIKSAIKSIKYGKVFDIVKELTTKSFLIACNDSSNRFDEFLSFLLERETYITYVPMHDKKKRQRGFNQSQIIAREIAEKINKKEATLLKKIKFTSDQASLKKESRLQNVKNCFQPIQTKLSLVSIKHVVLVDDVFTTGATMKECCRVLKQNGVKKVWGFTLARSN